METRMIAVPSRTKEILDRYGLRAKKGFGQNFLVDPVIVTRCAEMSHPEGAVIEIGPGIGSLTEALAKNAQHVIAYEIDAGLIPVLQDTLAPYDNVEIILQDFLECDVADQVKRLKEEYGQVTVCANLPYYITTPVLFRIFSLGNDIPYITVMVQKEVGNRFAARPMIRITALYLYRGSIFITSENCLPCREGVSILLRRLTPSSFSLKGSRMQTLPLIWMISSI